MSSLESHPSTHAAHAPSGDTAPGYRTRRLLGDLARRLPHTAVVAAALVTASACSGTTTTPTRAGDPTLQADLAAIMAAPSRPARTASHRVNTRELLAHPTHPAPARKVAPEAAPEAAPDPALVELPPRAERSPIPVYRPTAEATTGDAPVAQSRPRVQDAGDAARDDDVVPERVKQGGRRVRDAVADDAEWRIRESVRAKSDKVLNGALRRIGL